jgi:hypothetical protein
MKPKRLLARKIERGFARRAGGRNSGLRPVIFAVIICLILGAFFIARQEHHNEQEEVLSPHRSNQQ